jgi:hypothetical protein
VGRRGWFYRVERAEESQNKKQRLIGHFKVTLSGKDRTVEKITP